MATRRAPRLPAPLAAGALIALLVAMLAPALAFADPATPDEVLADESKRLRGLVVEADGFVERMEVWHEHAATLDELGRTLETWKPLLDELEQVRLMGQLGLFDLLAGADPSLAFIGPLLDTVQNGAALLDQLGQLAARLVVLGGDLDTLLTTPSLSADQLRALRAGIPGGIAAIEGVASEYTELRPTIDAAMRELDGAEQQLRAALAEALPLLGGGGSAGFQQQIDAVLGTVFGGVRELKASLDAMADSAATDVETLRRLETELVEAEAHHAFAGAEQLAAQGHLEQAREAFGLIAETWPTTHWGTEARSRRDDPAGSEQRLGAGAPEGNAPGVAWMLVVLLGTAAAAAGWVAWSRRRERASAPPAV